MKKIFKLLLFIAAACAVQRFCHKQTDGFAIEKISSALPYNPEWEIAGNSEENKVQEILKQPFSYLGKGAQCYVFQSQDEKYVIKFFRHSHMRPPLWTTFGPLPFSLENARQRKIQKMEGKLRKDFNSYKIAFETMKEPTGLIFLHLNKTGSLKQKILISDKLGIAHVLDADSMEFLVQKKASLVYPTIERLMEAGEVEKAEKALKNLVGLLVLRFQKGIFDKDPDLNTNFGFIGEDAVQIDIGRFKYAPERRGENADREEIIRITDHLKQWLDQRYPELSKHLQKAVAA